MTKSLKSGGKSEGDVNKRNTLKVGGDGGGLKKGLEQHRSQEDIYSAPQISKKGEKPINDGFIGTIFRGAKFSRTPLAKKLAREILAKLSDFHESEPPWERNKFNSCTDRINYLLQVQCEPNLTYSRPHSSFSSCCTCSLGRGVNHFKI